MMHVNVFIRIRVSMKFFFLLMMIQYVIMGIYCDVVNPLFDSLSHLQADCQSPEEDLFDIDRDIAFDCNMAQLFEQADVCPQSNMIIRLSIKPNI